MKRNITYTIDKLPKDRTDIKAVQAMTERQINKAARQDPDSPLLTEKELQAFKRVHPPSEIEVKKIRERLHISQSVFAAYFGVSKRTLQDWEQDRRQPSGPARILLALIAHHPKLVHRMILNEL